MEYDEYAALAEEEREKNRKTLGLFEEWLMARGLKKKTVNKHIDNVAFYINEYLLYEEIVAAADGIGSINGFFDWFFPRKAMWSNKSNTKEIAASLKKFYKFQCEGGLIEEQDYDFLLSEVKSNMDEWLSHYDSQSGW